MKTLQRISVVVRCPHCRKAVRWSGRFSRRERCPGCRRPFVILHDDGEVCEVRPESDDAIGEMICDWLRPDDLDEVSRLYDLAYPENAFDPRMLETGCFRGIRQDGSLVSAAGVHVYSGRYRVAALGNVATHPVYRGRGLSRAATAATCLALLETVDDIGLNVRADNVPAVACYRHLGFEIAAHYGEFVFQSRRAR